MAGPTLDTVRGAVRSRPELALYLVALALLPFRWLSPFGDLSDRAIWADLLFGAAALVWLVRGAPRRRSDLLARPWQVALGVLLGLTVLSAAIAQPQTGSLWTNVLVGVELVVIALMTADFASEADGRVAIGAVVVATAVITAGLAAVGLLLFYVGVDRSGLLGAYGEQFIPSSSYARVEAGFYSPPLLASWCIFASAVVARNDLALPPKGRIAIQAALFFTVLSTLSRGVLGFVSAVAIRYGRRRPGRGRLAVGLVLGCVLVIGALSVGRLHLDPTRPSSLSYEVPDPGNRRLAFTTSLETLGDHPVLGLGPGTFPGDYNGPFRAHFTPLNVAATLGLPALVALGLAVFLLWRGRTRPTDVATWSGLAGLAIDGLAQDIEHFRHVWILLGIAAAQQLRRK